MEEIKFAVPADCKKFVEKILEQVKKDMRWDDGNVNNYADAKRVFAYFGVFPVGTPDDVMRRIKKDLGVIEYEDGNWPQIIGLYLLHRKFPDGTPDDIQKVVSANLAGLIDDMVEVLERELLGPTPGGN